MLLILKFFGVVRIDIIHAHRIISVKFNKNAIDIITEVDTKLVSNFLAKSILMIWGYYRLSECFDHR